MRKKHLGTLTVVAALALSAATTSGVAARTTTDYNAQTSPLPPETQVVQLAEQYLRDRDQGWLEPGEQASPHLAAHQIGAQPASVSSGIAQIAAELAEERGLRASEVRTGFLPGADVQIDPERASVTTTSVTSLTWNDDELGESMLSDRYRLDIVRASGDWHIEKVTYVDPPTTDESARQSTATEQAETERSSVDMPAEPAAEPPHQFQTVSYDREAAAAYARTWSIIDHSPGATPRYNRDYHHVWFDEDEYPDYDSVNDCTNFASQMLVAGGWPKVPGLWPGNVENWTDALSWPSPYRASETWTVAYMLWRFMTESGRAEAWESGSPAETDAIWDLQPGDVLFADWDPDKKPDGKIDHAMLISGTYTELGFTEPVYSQHTPHRHNVPLSLGIKIATSEPPPVDPGNGMGGQGREVDFYPVHVKDSFES